MLKNNVISSGIWFTISNFFVRSIGLVTTPIFTRMLTKAEFGSFNNFSTWTGIILVVVSLNLEASLIRAKFDFKDDLDNYVTSMILLSTLSTGIWYIIACIFRSSLSVFLSMDFKYISCMFVYLMFYPVINIFQTMERFNYKYKLTVAISVSVSVSTSVLSVLLVYCMPDHLMGRTIGYVLPVAVVGGLLFIYCIIKKSIPDIKYWKYALPFTLPYIPHLLSMNLLSGMDRVMINRMCGLEELALYSLAYTCGTLVSILVTSINSAYSPWLGQKLSEKNYSVIKQISVPYVGAFTYAAGGAILIIPELLYIMGGPSYMEAKYVMPPVAASCVLQFIYCMYVNVEQYEKKTGRMALASVIAVIINYVLNTICIPLYGYIAAAYTTYASYFVLMVLHILIVKNIGMSHVYNNKKIIFIAGISICLALIANIIVGLLWIRYAIFLLYCLIGLVFIYKYRSNIIFFMRRK